MCVNAHPFVKKSGDVRYWNCFRRNYGQLWASRQDEAVELLGGLASSLA